MESEFSNIRFNEVHVIATLGVGGFGRVELVSEVINTQFMHLYHLMNVRFALTEPETAHISFQVKVVYTIGQ